MKLAVLTRLPGKLTLKLTFSSPKWSPHNSKTGMPSGFTITTWCFSRSSSVKERRSLALKWRSGFFCIHLSLVVKSIGYCRWGNRSSQACYTAILLDFTLSATQGIS
jgi:hypothetical protein